MADVEAQLDDVLVIMGLSFDKQYGEAWNRAQLESMLTMPHTRLWTAYSHHDRLIGFSVVRTIAQEAEIMLIAIAPEFQRQSAGNEMLKTITAQSKNDGVTHIFLEVRANNHALQFYKKIGFKQIGLRKDYYKGKENIRYDALTLAKTIM
ncbi:ribosomal protein S18-alanine N-acetyltransferase [Parasphingorhabdus sp. DH2-15]|uniref:ribosomal protein S18-alanine N-acetyltransferase n=1 Tax=Parasphingorhabdus sp. DH2-15 TaxID=3444112 RepID=UPI003F683DD8